MVRHFELIRRATMAKPGRQKTAIEDDNILGLYRTVQTRVSKIILISPLVKRQRSYVKGI